MGPEKIASPPLDEAWLSARLDYFETYCAKSVHNQSNTNFTWLIYFDSQTDPAVFQRLAYLKSSGPKIEFVRADHFDHMLEDMRLRLSQIQQPFLITTRLDNDDLISRDFVKLIQQAFVPEHMTLINFNSGYEYDLEQHLIKKWNQRFHNQFISLVEKKTDADAMTVYGFPHWGPPAEVKEINLAQPAAWMHLRHINNYSPNTYKAIPVFRSRELKQFPIDHHFHAKGLILTLRYAVQWFPRMLWRRLTAKTTEG